MDGSLAVFRGVSLFGVSTVSPLTSSWGRLRKEGILNVSYRTCRDARVELMMLGGRKEVE